MVIASYLAARRHRGRHRRVSRTRKRALLAGITSAAASGAILLAASGASSATTASAPPVHCDDVNVPVSSGAVRATMHGRLCKPAGRDDAPVQTLLAGGTYNSSYWSSLDTETSGESYVQHANRGGWATLALDRIGTGRSTHPDSRLVTGTVQADAVHQVIAAARAGALDRHPHRQIVLVGHSLGSMVSVMVAGNHRRDIDALVLTGYSHAVDPSQVGASLAAMHPAADEGLPLDRGYLTTRPGLRAKLFHSADDADPVITAAEEKAKDVGSSSELADAVAVGTSAATSRAIRVPVLEAVGGADTWACSATDCRDAAALRAAEQPAFSVPLATYVQPKAGHTVTLAADRAQVLDVITRWLDRALHR